MNLMGLSAPNYQLWLQGMAQPGRTRTLDVDVLDRTGKVLSTLTQKITDGSVVCDRQAEVTRVLTMTMLDPSHALDFDADNPADGALYADRQLRVTEWHRVETLGFAVSAVVFVGPVVKFSRSGATVNIEAHGRERYAMGQFRHPLTVKKKTLKVSAIKTILRRPGEDTFDFPNATAKMPKRISYGRAGVPWTSAKKIGDGMDRQLFYTGEGMCTLRSHPKTAVFTFATGKGGLVLADPEVTSTIEDLKNVVTVYGRKPKGKHKHRVSATATAPATNALRPGALGQNSGAKYLYTELTNGGLRTRAACKKKAERILSDKLRATTEVQFECVPVPHLEVGDICRLTTDAGTWTFRLDKFTLPLSTDGTPTMTVGYLKRRYPNKKAIRG